MDRLPTGTEMTGENYLVSVNLNDVVGGDGVWTKDSDKRQGLVSQITRSSTVPHTHTYIHIYGYGTLRSIYTSNFSRSPFQEPRLLPPPKVLYAVVERLSYVTSSSSSSCSFSMQNPR